MQLLEQVVLELLDVGDPNVAGELMKEDVFRVLEGEKIEELRRLVESKPSKN